MTTERVGVAKCEKCGKDLRTRGEIRPLMNLTCKCGHQNVVHPSPAKLRPWRKAQKQKAKEKKRAAAMKKAEQDARFAEYAAMDAARRGTGSRCSVELWWNQNGRSEAMCDACMARVPRYSGHLHGGWLICNRCWWSKWHYGGKRLAMLCSAVGAGIILVVALVIYAAIQR